VPVGYLDPYWRTPAAGSGGGVATVTINPTTNELDVVEDDGTHNKVTLPQGGDPAATPEVATEAARLALTTLSGVSVIQSDTRALWRRIGTDMSLLTSWAFVGIVPAFLIAPNGDEIIAPGGASIIIPAV
jgi:hypothetical protein